MQLHSSNFRSTFLCAVVLLWGAALGRNFAAPQQASTQTAPAAAGKGTVPADFPRGIEQMYMIKCWMCHNEYAKAGPPLKDLAKRPKLISGEPVNSQTVAEKIRAGSQRMPSYRYTLSDEQVNELSSFLLSGKCCPDPNNPAPNPQYRNR